MHTEGSTRNQQMEDDAGTGVFLPDDENVWVPATVASVDGDVSFA